MKKLRTLKKKPVREVICGTQFSNNLSDNRDRAFFELQGRGAQDSYKVLWTS